MARVGPRDGHGPSPSPGAGRLRLGFQRAPDGRSYVAEQYAGYPFHLGRAHYLDPLAPGLATVYIQSSAGGIFAGDRLGIDISAGPGAAAHVTTQASTIVHRTAPGGARQDVAVTAAAGSLVEYLADPAILFPGAALSSVLDVRVANDAAVVVQEGFLGHDPEGGGAAFGSLESTLRIADWQGRLLALDRYAVTGAEVARRPLGGGRRFAAHGSFAVIAPGRDGGPMVEALRAAIDSVGGAVYGGASALPNGCGAWARVAAADGAALKAALGALWVAARTGLTGHAPGRRRK